MAERNILQTLEGSEIRKRYTLECAEIRGLGNWKKCHRAAAMTSFCHNLQLTVITPNITLLHTLLL